MDSFSVSYYILKFAGKKGKGKEKGKGKKNSFWQFSPYYYLPKSLSYLTPRALKIQSLP